MYELTVKEEKCEVSSLCQEDALVREDSSRNAVSSWDSRATRDNRARIGGVRHIRDMRVRGDG